tara:strand:+ start:769 stop:1218 length:450 start_codon:yes stop_codon:yes gene_type:complete
MAKSLPFNLDVSDVIVPSHCPLTFIPLMSHDGKGDSLGGSFESPTLDRVIPHLGYIKGNVRVVSGLANSIKGSLIDPEIMADAAKTFAKNIHQYMNKETLYADIDSRHRNRSPVEIRSDGSLHLIDGSFDGGDDQLQFEFNSSSNQKDQ